MHPYKLKINTSVVMDVKWYSSCCMSQLKKMKKELFKQELESLLRTLDFIREEQAFIKKKLTNFTDNIDDTFHIQWAEEMQQQILNRESALQLINKDISALKVSKTIDQALLKKDKQQVNYLENEFIQWKHTIDQKIDIMNSID
jgi:hypothetical protein